MARKFKPLPLQEDLSRDKVKFVLSGMYDCFKIHDMKTMEGALAFELAKRLGVKVSKSGNFYKNNELCLTIRGRKDVTATIPSGQPLDIQNYTLAMALGFYVIHYLYPGLDLEEDAMYKKTLEIKAACSDEATMFRQANIFAQHMTMPNGLIALEKKKNTSCRKVAKMFAVPQMMAAIRLRDFVPTQPPRKPAPRPKFY